MACWVKCPTWMPSRNPQNEFSTTIYSSDYEVLGSYYTENRVEISYDELSPYLVQALVSTEDKRFYDHSGIDLGAFRAVVLTGLLRRDAGGGSTLTQQLAKNLFHDDFEHAGTARGECSKN